MAQKIKNSVIIESPVSNSETKPVEVSPETNVVTEKGSSDESVFSITPEKFFFDNMLVPHYLNDEDGNVPGETVPFCLVLGGMRFPEVFTSMDDAYVWVVNHPVRVMAAVVELYDKGYFKSLDNEQA
ncbi:hypothetical protein [Sigmofec virus UA08Rod_6079]|uniref:Uncharacterized protein n=1 Tax=Sigmofec virus UA08Rod_6079 TaxID=2929450 RepID=A0A976R6U9_9VIRU|nr:hypothetical protein [Sigmofec virus UA08Rod_6079]